MNEQLDAVVEAGSILEADVLLFAAAGRQECHIRPSNSNMN